MSILKGTPRLFIGESAPAVNDYVNDPPSRPSDGDLWLKMSTPALSVYVTGAWHTITIT